MPVVSEIPRARATAVDEFSRFHDACDRTVDRSQDPSRYRSLVPLEAPATGQQYAFEVDLDACTGCKACVTACHSLNGLDEGESWRSVGLLVGTSSQPFQQSVTSACHHCIDPACLKGCPVEAYEKDSVTGIVRHLDDECIGCRYCTLTCPYEVPRFNARLGIVRKCDMCSGRLSHGEAPACVQGCPNAAISIRVVDTVEATVAVVTGSVLPHVPDPSITRPTTRYTTGRAVIAESAPADLTAIEPSHSHPPLTAMLVLSQSAVGSALAGLVTDTLSSVNHHAVGRYLELPVSIGVFGTISLALVASIFHLGRPRLAYRAVRGIGHSWLSREVLFLGAFAGAAALALCVAWARGGHAVPIVRGIAASTGASWAVVFGVTFTGVAGIVSSAMVYAATGRWWWRWTVSMPKFFLTACIGGSGSLMAACVAGATFTAGTTGNLFVGPARIAALVLLASTAVKLSWEALMFRHCNDGPASVPARTARLLRADLWSTTKLRFACGLAGGVIVPLLVALFLVPAAGIRAPAAHGALWAVLAAAAVVAVTIGELAERSQFFAAESSPRMPGPLR